MKMFFLANSILQASLTGMANRSVIVGAILAFLLLVRLIRGMKDGDSKKVNSSLIGIVCIMLAIVLALWVLGHINVEEDKGVTKNDFDKKWTGKRNFTRWS